MFLFLNLTSLGLNTLAFAATGSWVYGAMIAVSLAGCAVSMILQTQKDNAELELD